MSWGERDRWSEEVSLAAARRGPFYLIGQEGSVYLLYGPQLEVRPKPRESGRYYSSHVGLIAEILCASWAVNRDWLSFLQVLLYKELVHFCSQSRSSEWLRPHNLPESKWSVLGDLLLSHSWNCQKTTNLFIATTETDKLTKKRPKREACILAHNCRQWSPRFIALGLR